MSEREKETTPTRTQEQTRQARGQEEDNKGKAPEDRQRRKTEDKRIKTEANTQQASNPPNYSRTQKPHKPHKAPRQHKPTQQPQTALKTPLKCEIEPYSQATHQTKSSKADKRRGTQHERRSIRKQPRPPAPSGHDEGRHGTHHRAPSLYSPFKISLIFALFGLRKSRENTKHPQKFIHFCPLLPTFARFV